MILRLTGFTPPVGLGPLERREHWRPPELDACRHCPPSALAGALADQLTLELGDDFASRNLRRRAGALLSLVASTQPQRTTPGPTRKPHHGTNVLGSGLEQCRLAGLKKVPRSTAMPTGSA